MSTNAFAGQASGQLAFIGLGANLGDARAAVLQAVQDLAALPQTQLLHASSLYRSAPVDAGGPDYINAVAQIRTELAAHGLLRELQKLERQAGRQRPYPNAPRTLDLDLLLYGDLVLNETELTLPHPRMKERAFVLLPLAEIAPSLVDPRDLAQVASQRIEKLG